jgi:HK97 family phage portal protein
MRVIPGTAIQVVSKYVYSANGVDVPIDAPTLLHMKMFHPTDDWYGLSPIQVAARSVDQNNEAKAWNVALLQNGGVPAGALSTDGALSDEQYNRLRDLLDNDFTGMQNAGRPLLLEGGVRWQEMGGSPKDMMWESGLKFSSREIANAFGVPSELIGDNENKTYSNYQEARKALYEETILPLMDWLRDEWNMWLVSLYGDNLYLDYDKDAIEALQLDRQVIWTSAIDAKKAGVITTNEARELLGYEAREDGDELQSVPTLGADPSTNPPEDPAKDPASDPGDDNTKSRIVTMRRANGRVQTKRLIVPVRHTPFSNLQPLKEVVNG